MKKTYIEKQKKYEELAKQIRRMWGAETTEIIPVIISSTGLIHLELRNIVKKLGLQEYVIKKMQKAVLIETCGIIRKVLGEL